MKGKLAYIVIVIFALSSFRQISEEEEFNCWYYFNDKSTEFKITFAITPELVFEAKSSSTVLRKFVLKYGIRDKFREGIYCPETKIKIKENNNEIVGIEILGFRNTTKDLKITLSKPILIERKHIVDRKNVLEYVMTY